MTLRTVSRGRLLPAVAVVALLAACGGNRPEGQPATSEQTLTDLFNLSGLYQRLGRLAGAGPVPFVGQAVQFAGRADSTIVLLGLSLDNRALSFQRSGREFSARYRVEVSFQRTGALPIRYARDEVVQVANFDETQRTDETVVFQQGFLLPPGDYTLGVIVRDPGAGTFSRAEIPYRVAGFGAGSFSAPVLVYRVDPRRERAAEPGVILNPRGTVAHGGDSLAVFVEAYGLTGPTSVPVVLRDENNVELERRDMRFTGGQAVEGQVLSFPPEVPALGRVTVTVGQPGQEQQTTALVSFSRTWVVTNYDNLLDLLRFFGHEDRLNQLRNAPSTERAALWRRFWVETDPRPETPENEALERYFTRVAIANERFREEGGAGFGWRSDRGEVFITIGPPDQELETPPGNDTRIVQWVYSDYRAVLTFTGALGFSRLRLTPASRAEFNRVRMLARQREAT